MNKKILATACFFAALAVILGAFGAHGLKGQISSSALENWKTAVDYHFYHVLGLLFLSIFPGRASKAPGLTFWCFLIGILFFSGSLYLLSTREITGLQASFLGPITPLGGMFFIIGWISLFVEAIRSK
ncbi:DUF423 domain-containing protein [Pedobacter sp. SYSU D00535]|uniref:DUF423 domain-containing protein n=1 Tax=Pedobacter sp. SYSU D00535 TaxID=2810308 RepID=UPI001A972060|nr:DUF423 domain-containing protein [Pedobacter sp. SYSU D00535]